MNNVLEYKGYHTRVEFDADSRKLYGVIEGINDLVDFIADDPSSVDNEFHKAVDDYIALCNDLGRSPDKEYKGMFNVRIPPEYHRELAVKALKENISLNAVVEEAIGRYLAEEK